MCRHDAVPHGGAANREADGRRGPAQSRMRVAPLDRLLHQDAENITLREEEEEEEKNLIILSAVFCIIV